MGNVAGGEGYDWFYASDADRQAQLRTPITDGAHGEPWLWRYKDIRNWWSRAHHDRPGGVRSASPTAWVPGSKPVIFTELGCGAVDKGANKPNIFGDPKSAESGRPYFSSGLPDPLIQRQVLRAHQRWWADPANNPTGMVDIERMFLWTWDARPYPAFPALDQVWADGPNHRNGHWLTGRLGGAAVDELAQAIAADHGVAITAEPASPWLAGLVLGTATTARDALEPVIAASGLSLRNRAAGLHLGQPRRSDVTVLDVDRLAADDGAILARRRGSAAEAPGRLALTYLDRERDYLTGTVTALSHGDGPLATRSSAMALDASGARLTAERLLDGLAVERETLDFTLPPAELALEPGDLVNIGGLSDGPFEITEIRDGTTRRVTARSLPSGTATVTGVDRPLTAGNGPAVRSIPHVLAAHLPPTPDDPMRSRIVLAAYAQPWPGSVHLMDEATGAAATTVTRRCFLGRVVTPLAPGPTGVWDRGNAVDLEMLAGHLASAEPAAVLSGSNRLAIETDTGAWEVIGFGQSELIAPGRYRLSRLLRGLAGTAAGSAGYDRPVIMLDARVATLAVEASRLGELQAFRVYAGGADVEGRLLELQTSAGPALPLPPVHLRARRDNAGDIVISWIRRSRADGDGWGAVDSPLEHVPEHYRLTILNGAAAVRVVETGTPSASYTAAAQLSDFGAVPAAFVFTVAQSSTVMGPGHVAWGEFHG
jgi:hypothetical protein